MVATNITVTVGPDGTVHLPIEAARPGETIILRIERADTPGEGFDRYGGRDNKLPRLNRLTARTPEERQQIIDEFLRIGRETRERLPEDQRTSNHDWLYDDDGLPT